MQTKLSYDCNFSKQLWLRLQNLEKKLRLHIISKFSLLNRNCNAKYQFFIVIQIVFHFDVQILKDFKKNE